MTVDVLKLDWDKGGGLLPAIVQHAGTASVLMLAYMSPESLERTLATGRVTFFSRSRQALWTKGETSGNFLELVDIEIDCDRDTLLVRALPAGPVCHRGTDNCFDTDDYAFLTHLETIIGERAGASADGSYTARLLAGGTPGIAQKVGEEAVEVALAAVTGSDAEFLDEAADLFYHLMVLLKDRNVSLADVSARLAQRHAAADDGLAAGAG